MIFSDNDYTLILKFSNINSNSHEEKNLKLTGFSLKANTYTSTNLLINNNDMALNEKAGFEAIHDAMLKMQKDQSVDWDEVYLKLGKPVGHITASEVRSVTLYSPNILLISKSERLDSITILEKSFLADDKHQSVNVPW